MLSMFKYTTLFPVLKEPQKNSQIGNRKKRTVLKNSAPDVFLQGSENPISCVSQTRENVAVFIEFLIHGCAVNLDVRMSLGQNL